MCLKENPGRSVENDWGDQRGVREVSLEMVNMTQAGGLVVWTRMTVEVVKSEFGDILKVEHCEWIRFQGGSEGKERNQRCLLGSWSGW